MLKHAQLDALPRSLREAVESAGYRVARWLAAREVLGTRVANRRLQGSLADFLDRWSPPSSVEGFKDTLSLDLLLSGGTLRIVGGNDGLTSSPTERALLHLPALRDFWRQELRQAHFTALCGSIPQAWIMAPAPVPPGAVIHGLGITSWNQLGSIREAGWISVEQILTHEEAPAPTSRVIYSRDDSGRVVLRSFEASP